MRGRSAVVVACWLVVGLQTPAQAQRRWSLRGALGQSLITGDEGPSVGTMSEIGILRTLGTNRSVQLSIVTQQFRPEALGPCLIVRGTRCYSTSERATGAILLGLREKLPKAPGGGLVASGGVGMFLSTRTLRDPADCSVPLGCTRAEAKEEWNDVAYGVYSQLGHAFSAGSHEFVVEWAFHLPLLFTEEHKPLSRYRTLPMMIAVHF